MVVRSFSSEGRHFDGIHTSANFDAISCTCWKIGAKLKHTANPANVDQESTSTALTNPVKLSSRRPVVTLKGFFDGIS